MQPLQLIPNQGGYQMPTPSVSTRMPLQRQSPPSYVNTPLYGPGIAPQIEEEFIRQIMQMDHGPGNFGPLVRPPLVPPGSPGVQSMPMQPTPESQPRNPASTLERLSVNSGGPVPRQIAPGMGPLTLLGPGGSQSQVPQQQIARDYSPYDMAERQPAAAPQIPWTETGYERPPTTIPMGGDGPSRQSASSPVAPTPVAPERMYENSHRGAMEKRFFEGLDPSRQAMVMQMKAMADQARDTNSHTANRYDQRTGQWYTEQTPGQYQINQYGNVPLTDKQRANRAAKDDRYQNFLAERKDRQQGISEFGRQELDFRQMMNDAMAGAGNGMDTNNPMVQAMLMARMGVDPNAFFQAQAQANAYQQQGDQVQQQQTLQQRTAAAEGVNTFDPGSPEYNQLESQKAAKLWSKMWWRPYNRQQWMQYAQTQGIDPASAGEFYDQLAPEQTGTNALSPSLWYNDPRAALTSFMMTGL